ncbi:DUF4041 domain-containing protein [Jiella marina]|uniref:DUF4041 domain-containing protein n=1 Tax=Jiella sp. LLJ827 TaxID=2917712 RepID=UPI002101A66D|nr:DUF4041 domain-containing protein [Jiella sp. LLJ827]MCQ0986498.1 DUF4041 domain-containing protein [Jiella sp. LLJ827]
MDAIIVYAVICAGAAPIFLALWIFQWRRRRQVEDDARMAKDRSDRAVGEIRERYSSIISEEDEVKRLQGEVEGLKTDVRNLRAAYAEKRAIFDRLEKQVAIYDERLSFAELGVYEPHFEFSDGEAYKRAILTAREQQKLMVKNKTATYCPREWSVDGSVAKGRTMMNRQVRLSMRAFNNECEAAIANVRWNNINAMEKRILSAETAINRENESMELTLDHRYVELKLKELRLTHEWREKQKAEKEERAELARAEREEKKLQADAERAEREEQKYQALLAKARREAEMDVGNDKLRARVAALESSLAEAHAASERARAMAELTTSGYVYIISNAGSFGEDVVKIGLTRRLDPDDRVRELGDASVPFTFDTHAMIYSETAPALEAALHREFADRRINGVNMRKEFFRVTLDEVERAVSRLAPDANFFKDREAQEWQETLARRNEFLRQQQAAWQYALPSEI